MFVNSQTNDICHLKVLNRCDNARVAILYNSFYLFHLFLIQNGKANDLSNNAIVSDKTNRD